MSDIYGTNKIQGNCVSTKVKKNASLIERFHLTYERDIETKEMK